MLKSPKFALVTIGYWFLFLYAILALLFWFMSLNQQNQSMTQLKIAQLNTTQKVANYKTEYTSIINFQKRKTAQYIGEGVTFLAILIVGAFFVYRSIKKQLKLNQQQQNFLMAVTHELKTPIAITQLNLETLRKRKLDAEQQDKILVNTLQEANRLNSLCNNILLTSQFDSGVYKSAKQEIFFSDLVNICVAQYTKRYPQRQIIAQVEEHIFINGETLLIEMLVNNLIDNALKYSPKTSAIQVVLQKNNGMITFKIVDEGIGILEDEKKNIFEKFYRAQDEVTRKTKGTGLGLYLCKKIVESHNGTIMMIPNKPTGSVFITQFNTND